MEQVEGSSEELSEIGGFYRKVGGARKLLPKEKKGLHLARSLTCPGVEGQGVLSG